MQMTLEEIYREELGSNWEKKLSRRLVKIVKKLDSLPTNQKPVSQRILKSLFK